MQVDSTIHCFINHGCNGTNNVGHDISFTESSANPWSLPVEILDKYFGKTAVYNPAKERQVSFYSSAIPLRDIQGGEELFDNYLGMTGKPAVRTMGQIDFSIFNLMVFIPFTLPFNNRSGLGILDRGCPGIEKSVQWRYW